MLCSNVKKHNDSKFLDYLDIKVNQTVTPSNAERRIQMKKSAAYWDLSLLHAIVE
jgi:hypothetical protein